MKFHDPGVVYKASPRAFLGNYLIAAGIIIITFLVADRFSLVFTISPVNVGELVGTIVYFGFAISVIYFVSEFFFQGIIKKYIVTKNGIIKIEGILWKKKLMIPYQSVAEVRVSKGIFGRILNYGTIEITGYKEHQIEMKHMNDPEQIQRVLQHKISMGRVDEKKKRKEDKDVDAVE